MSCYECNKKTNELSPRSRCVECEYRRAKFNEKENYELRKVLAKVKGHLENIK